MPYAQYGLFFLLFKMINNHINTNNATHKTGREGEKDGIQ